MGKNSIINLKIVVISLSILSLFLLTAITIGAWWITKRSSEHLAPQEGVWYCETLGLKLSFDQDEESVWSNGDTVTTCMFSSNKYSPYLTVHEIEDRLPTGIGTSYAYLAGDVLFNFKIKSFSNDSMVVGDDAGNVFVFQSVDKGTVLLSHFRLTLRKGDKGTVCVNPVEK